MSGVLKDARVVMGTWVPLRVGCSRVVCPRVRAGVEMHVARGDGFFIYGFIIIGFAPTRPIPASGSGRFRRPTAVRAVGVRSFLNTGYTGESPRPRPRSSLAVHNLILQTREQKGFSRLKIEGIPALELLPRPYNPIKQEMPTGTDPSVAPGRTRAAARAEVGELDTANVLVEAPSGGDWGMPSSNSHGFVLLVAGVLRKSSVCSHSRR